jgi:hypothetical protein
MTPLEIPCPAGCATVLERVMDETESAKGPRIEVYRCPDTACARKVAVIYEPGGGLSQDQRTWVEREVARTGAFFPQDYPGMGGPRRR